MKAVDSAEKERLELSKRRYPPLICHHLQGINSNPLLRLSPASTNVSASVRFSCVWFLVQAFIRVRAHLAGQHDASYRFSCQSTAYQEAFSSHADKYVQDGILSRAGDYVESLLAICNPDESDFTTAIYIDLSRTSDALSGIRFSLSKSRVTN